MTTSLQPGFLALSNFMAEACQNIPFHSTNAFQPEELAVHMMRPFSSHPADGNKKSQMKDVC